VRFAVKKQMKRLCAETKLCVLPNAFAPFAVS